jgi:hypothetical protein
MASIPLTVAALLIAQFGVAYAASARLAVTKTEHRVLAGTTADLQLSADSDDFVATLAHISAETTPPAEYQISVGHDPEKQGLFLAVPLTMMPGIYSVTLSATNTAGETRNVTLSVDVRPIPHPAVATRPPVILLNGYSLIGCPPARDSTETFGILRGDPLVSSAGNVNGCAFG